MKRRAFLSLAGLSLTGLAGCSGAGSDLSPSPVSTGTRSRTPTIVGPRIGDDLPVDPDPEDGYPPTFESSPAKRSIDTNAFGTLRVNGVDVPLAPIESTYYWYARREARFADARYAGQYDRAHIYGAVFSPATVDISDDPVTDWPIDERIVCYCGCPHHLSALRASQLIQAGYESVYVIDEGVGAWYERDYPMAGSQIESRPEPWLIEGSVAPRYAGETVIARHPPTAQGEAGQIASDGRFSLALHFADVSADTEIVLETPGYRVVDRLGALTAGLVQPPA